jgi:hypothetical protein
MGTDLRSLRDERVMKLRISFWCCFPGAAQHALFAAPIALPEP